ncbi:MAG: AraC family transcriptional regulator [Clostridia bacterium]|nr:AraC family transcriptional regulator [Clostridia bacterium]
MSYDTDRYSLKKDPNQSLAVVECGIQICHSGHTAPKITYRTYSAHFILEGKGTYSVNGKTYELSPGQGFMITPGTTCIYTADIKEPWKYVYASFCGVDDDALVRNAGLDDENVIFKFPLDDEMIHDIYAMHAAGKKNEAKGYDVTGYFLLCMSRLVKANHTVSAGNDLSENYVKKAVYYIEENHSFDITVSDIAFHVGLDRTYLYRLFCKHYGCSPSKYLMNYRLNRAVEMLENCDLSISEIGILVGFHDVSHFYKAFTAKYGMPPKKYRSEHYGEEN